MYRFLIPLAVFLLLGACGSPAPTLTFVADTPPEELTVRAIADLVMANSDLEIEVISAYPRGNSIEFIQNGRADLALVSNDHAAVDELSSSVPVYTSVLHIFYRDDLPTPSLGDLLTRPDGWYGIEGSSSNEFVRRLATLADVEAIANAPQAGGPDNQPVIVLLEALNSGFVRFLQNRKWYSFGRPDALGHGTMAEGISARIPQIRPYVVPAFTYGAATPEPILTLAVDTHIVMRSDLAEDTVYRFTQTLVENKARFGPTHPGLFRGIREDFDRSTLAFPLHSGARRYLDRDQPTMFERYAEVANVSVYLLIIIATAIAASIRWHSRRRKVRVDAYYGKVLTIRRRALAQPGEDHGEAINAVQSIYDEALEKLKDEQLAPNESFHILMTLCSDTIRELRGHASPVRDRADEVRGE